MPLFQKGVSGNPGGRKPGVPGRVPVIWRHALREFFATKEISEELKAAVLMELRDATSGKALTRELIRQAYGAPQIDVQASLDIRQVVVATVDANLIEEAKAYAVQVARLAGDTDGHVDSN